MFLKRKKLSRKWKKEYYRFIDQVVRSHGIQKFLVRLLYFACFVATVVLATLIYING